VTILGYYYTTKHWHGRAHKLYNIIIFTDKNTSLTADRIPHFQVLHQGRIQWALAPALSLTCDIGKFSKKLLQKL